MENYAYIAMSLLCKGRKDGREKDHWEEKKRRYNLSINIGIVRNKELYDCIIVVYSII